MNKVITIVLVLFFFVGLNLTNYKIHSNPKIAVLDKVLDMGIKIVNNTANTVDGSVAKGIDGLHNLGTGISIASVLLILITLFPNKRELN